MTRPATDGSEPDLPVDAADPDAAADAPIVDATLALCDRVGSDGGPRGDWTNWKHTAPADDARWMCMELHLDATTSTIEVWIDGVAKPAVAERRSTSCFLRSIARRLRVVHTRRTSWATSLVEDGGDCP